MPLGMIFWVLMLLGLIFGLGWTWRWGEDPGSRVVFGSNLILFILLFLLGWAAFGFVVK